MKSRRTTDWTSPVATTIVMATGIATRRCRWNSIATEAATMNCTTAQFHRNQGSGR